MGRYERKVYHALPNKPEQAANEPPGEYQAITELRGKVASRFKIVDKNGVSYGCSYAHLIEWIYTPPDIITIMTTTRIFILEGENLDLIENGFMESKITVLKEFNHAIYKKPEDDKAVIIHSIEVKNQD